MFGVSIQPNETKSRLKTSHGLPSILKISLLFFPQIENKRLDELGLVIIDELHMIGDGSQRGAGLEVRSVTSYSM